MRLVRFVESGFVFYINPDQVKSVTPASDFAFPDGQSPTSTSIMLGEPRMGGGYIVERPIGEVVRLLADDGVVDAQAAEGRREQAVEEQP
jgi:hypothetical protein